MVGKPSPRSVADVPALAGAALACALLAGASPAGSSAAAAGPISGAPRLLHDQFAASSRKHPARRRVRRGRDSRGCRDRGPIPPRLERERQRVEFHGFKPDTTLKAALDAMIERRYTDARALAAGHPDPLAAALVDWFVAREPESGLTAAAGHRADGDASRLAGAGAPAAARPAGLPRGRSRRRRRARLLQRHRADHDRRQACLGRRAEGRGPAAGIRRDRAHALAGGEARAESGRRAAHPLRRRI